MHRAGISDNAAQRILLATVPWFTSNRFAGKSNYPAASGEPRIKKHWDLRKIPTRYKSRLPRNLLSLVPVPRSSLAVDRGLSRERDPDRSRMIEEKRSRFFETWTTWFLTHWFSGRPFNSIEKRLSVYQGIPGKYPCHSLCRTISICDELITGGSIDRQRKGRLLLPSMRDIFMQVANYASRKIHQVSQWPRLRLSEFLERIVTELKCMMSERRIYQSVIFDTREFRVSLTRVTYRRIALSVSW